MFSRAIKRIIFPDTKTYIEFLNPMVDQQKNGLRHGDLIIVDQTKFL